MNFSASELLPNNCGHRRLISNRFQYDHTLCSYEYIDRRRLKMFSGQSPPDNCLSCALTEERDLHISPLKLTDNGVIHGLAFAGKHFHLEDFVLYRAESGPCHIGYIVAVTFEPRSAFVTVRKVGRISDLERILPSTTIKDEVRIFLIFTPKVQRTSK